MAPLGVATTPDGRRLELTRQMNTPPSAAWDLLVDTDRWPDWGPSVRAVDCAERRITAGSTGTVRVPGGLWIPFAVEEFSPPADGPGRWTWRVARIPATGHRVEPHENGCRVVFEIPLAAAGYAPVCRLALDRIESLL